jgi:phosphonate transport system ATP-binding protein
MTTAALLDIRGLTQRYADGSTALQDVGLQLPRGQFCVLLGASGSGKSTLLRAINGLQRPTAGEIRLDGRLLAPGQPRQRRGQVATIHQAVDLVPRLTVLDNVLSGALGELPTWRALLAVFGSARRQRACQLLHEVGLEEAQLYRRASELSGGQQQRVGIARAFMAAPLLVLADEPIASLDPQSSRRMLELLRRAARDHGATVLCSLHQVALGLEFADRIIALDRGQIVIDAAAGSLDAGHIDAIYQAPAPARAPLAVAA